MSWLLETNAVRSTNGELLSNMKLHPKLLENCHDIGWVKASVLQSKVLENIRNGNDLVIDVVGEGCGKTGSIALPIIDEFYKSQGIFFACVLAAEGELDKIAEQLRILGGSELNCLKVTAKGYRPRQLKFLKSTHIIVTRPSTLQEIQKEKLLLELKCQFMVTRPSTLQEIQKEKLSLELKCQFLVLADVATLDQTDVKAIDSNWNNWHGEKTKTLLFSSAREKVHQFMKFVPKHVMIEDAEEWVIPAQHGCWTPDDDESNKLYQLIQGLPSEDKSIIVFSTKSGVSVVCNYLTICCGYEVFEVDPWAKHASLQRLADFKDAKVKNRNRIILVCADAAKGLPIPIVDVVISEDELKFPELYNLRRARLGIWGGKNLSFVANEEMLEHFPLRGSPLNFSEHVDVLSQGMGNLSIKTVHAVANTVSTTIEKMETSRIAALAYLSSCVQLEPKRLKKPAC